MKYYKNHFNYTNYEFQKYFMFMQNKSETFYTALKLKLNSKSDNFNFPVKLLSILMQELIEQSCYVKLDNCSAA